MTKPRVLIVYGEPNICAVWQRTLGAEGYVVDAAADETQALEKLQHAEYDLILLDFCMESVSGLDVLRAVRQQNRETVVIVFTGHDLLKNAVEALHLGVFDYIFKPTTPEVVRQSVREGLHYRRQVVGQQHLVEKRGTLRQIPVNSELGASLALRLGAQQRFIYSGKLVIDRHRREATFEGRPIALTTTEFNILLELVLAAPHPVHPQNLAHEAMGYDYEDVQARDLVKWHIYHLRQKIETNPSEPQYIKNVRYKGYLWVGH